MTIETKNADPLWTAKRHKWFPSLCSLPSGEMIAAEIAVARGYTIADEQAPVSPEAPKAAAPDLTPPRPAPPAQPPTPVPPKAPPRPLPAPVAAVQPRPVAPHVPAAVLADRARILAIRTETPPGAERERDEAIRTGMSLDDFRQSLAAFTILDAIRASRGH